MNHDHDTRVRARAHQRWEEDGRPEGRHLEHWLAAEGEVANGDPPAIPQQGISNHPPDEENDRQQNLPPRMNRKRSQDGGGESESAA